MKKRYVLKNKAKFITSIVISLTIIFTLVFATSVYGYKQPQYITLTVEKGDTLWDIAQKYCTDSDIRKSVYEIKSLNKLSSSRIVEGDMLRIPQ